VKLFIDDVRPLPSNFDILVKDVWVAKDLILGCDVHHISFDHDLGSNTETGYVLAKWIEEQAYYGEIQRITYEIHSANTVGYANIMNAMIKADEYWADHRSDQRYDETEFQCGSFLGTETMNAPTIEAIYSGFGITEVQPYATISS
jgi:hypothetical protein